MRIAAERPRLRVRCARGLWPSYKKLQTKRGIRVGFLVLVVVKGRRVCVVEDYAEVLPPVVPSVLIGMARDVRPRFSAAVPFPCFRLCRVLSPDSGVCSGGRFPVFERAF